MKLSSPSIISSNPRPRQWIWCRCSPRFNIIAMPNIHFFGNSGSRAISSIGMSLYMMTSSLERDSTVIFKKSSSTSIIWRRFRAVRLTGSIVATAGTFGTFNSSKRMARMYSFKSKSLSLDKKLPIGPSAGAGACESASNNFCAACSSEMSSLSSHSSHAARRARSSGAESRFAKYCDSFRHSASRSDGCRCPFLILER